MKSMKNGIIVCLSAVVFALIALSPKISGEDYSRMIVLEESSNTYVWRSFFVSNETLKSPDERYLLKNVLRNGTVELIHLPCSESPEVIVVEPRESQSVLSKIYVVESDFKKQSATINELVLAEP
jgi:hypothetical protein